MSLYGRTPMARPTRYPRPAPTPAAPSLGTMPTIHGTAHVTARQRVAPPCKRHLLAAGQHHLRFGNAFSLYQGEQGCCVVGRNANAAMACGLSEILGVV